MSDLDVIAEMVEARLEARRLSPNACPAGLGDDVKLNSAKIVQHGDRLTRIEGRLDRVLEALDKLSRIDERIVNLERDTPRPDDWGKIFDRLQTLESARAGAQAKTELFWKVVGGFGGFGGIGAMMFAAFTLGGAG